MTHPTRPYLRRMPGLYAFCFVLSLLLAQGCGSGKGDDPRDSSAAGIERARDRADRARQAAEKDKASRYAPSEWADAREFYETAEGMETSGNAKAASRFKMAASRFKKAAGTAKRNKKSYDVAISARENYEKMRKSAQQFKLEETHPEFWAKAEEHYQKGLSLLENSKKFKTARKQFVYAYNELETAVDRNKEVATIKAKAEQLRASALAMRTKAEEAEAPEKSMADFEYGRDAEKDGDDYYSQGLYDQAQTSFRNAKDWYTYSIENTRQWDIAKRLQEATRPLDIDIPDSRHEAPTIEDIDIPDFDGGDDIVTDLRRLFHCAYEYQNGIIKLNYASGIELEKDVHTRGCRVKGDPNKRNLLFEGRAGVGRWARNYEDEEELEEEEEEDDWLDYSFAGNTHGQILLNCRFQDGVQIEFDVAYQLIIANDPHFQVLFNSDQRTGSYYATDWGTWLMSAEYKRQTKRSHTQDTEFPKKPPERWVLKRKPYHFKIRYNKRGEDETGRLRIWLNDTLTFDVKTANKYTGGFIGFRWHDVKFVVTELNVKGRLDTDWAREALARVGDEPEPEDIDDDFDF